MASVCTGNILGHPLGRLGCQERLSVLEQKRYRELALEVQDDRLDAPDTYHIPPLTPDGMELDIDGTFVVNLPPLFLLGNGGDEPTRLTFRITDRAGHVSNAVVSPVILITDTL